MKRPSCAPAAVALLIAAGVAPALAAGPPASAQVAIVAGSAGKSIGTMLPSLRDGDHVVLIAPGLQYYLPLSRAPVALKVRHLVPGRGRLTGDQYDGWKKALPLEPDVSSFDGGTIAARFGNAEIAVLALSQPEPPSARSTVFLDPGFFLPLYENEVRGGIVDLSLKLYRSLSERKATGGPLFVLDPLDSPGFPLHWAYVGELWKELWARPTSFKEAIPRKWALRKRAEFLAEFGQFEEAAAVLQDARTLFPGDGSIDFQLARFSFLEREIPSGIRFLNRAAKEDRRFLRGFSEFGEYLASKQRLPDAEMVLRAGLLVDRADPALNLGLSKLLVDRAESLQSDDPEEARRCLSEVLSLPVPEGSKQGARALLEKMGDVSPESRDRPGK